MVGVNNNTKLPNVIIPGAQKSGTTTLARLLDTHSNIYTGEQKEPHFFSKDRKFTRGIEFYGSYYSNYQGQDFVVDASQSYMPLDFVPERISETLGTDVRFIIVLRNPIDRVVSAFTHFKIQKGGEISRNIDDIIPSQLEGLTLEELIEYEAESVRRGLVNGSIQSRNDTWAESGFPFNYFHISCYSKHIANYFRYFSRENFLFLTFEEVTRQQAEVLHKTGRFLNIDPSGFYLDAKIHANPSLIYKNRVFSVLFFIKTTLKRVLPVSASNPFRQLERKWLMEKPKHYFSESSYRCLLEIFEPEINRVEALTGLNLSAWKIV